MAPGVVGRRDGRSKARSEAQQEHWKKVLERRRVVDDLLKKLSKEKEELDGEQENAHEETEDPEPSPPPAKRAATQQSASGGIVGKELHDQIAELVRSELSRVQGGLTKPVGESISAGGGYKSLPPPSSQAPLPNGFEGATQRLSEERFQAVEVERKGGPTPTSEALSADRPAAIHSTAASDLISVSRAASVLANQRCNTPADVRNRLNELLKASKQLLTTANGTNSQINYGGQIKKASAGAAAPNFKQSVGDDYDRLFN
jgi:hypothetical protein